MRGKRTAPVKTRAESLNAARKRLVIQGCRVLMVGFLYGILTIDARAASPWDGLWYFSQAESHLSDHEVSLEKLPRAKWWYRQGLTSVVLTLDGRPYPDANAQDFAVAARLDGTALEFVKSGYGRDVYRELWQLADGGSSLVITHTGILPDGREATRSRTAKRLTGESGFAGKWRIMVEDKPSDTAPPNDRLQEAAKDAVPRPFWVISTAADGTMSWFIPATGELIRGKTDGQSRPITGPLISRHFRFFWKRVSANQIEFFASTQGRLVERATETLAADGTTFIDTLWTVGHEDEKDIRVFHKR